jgi:aerobic carbon-monoxide dehydrogenase medium subunit
MKPARFAYFRPAVVSEAVEILERYDGNARVLAGGQSLVPLLNFRLVAPEALIDLGRCADVSGLSRDGDALVFGAMVRQATAESSDLVRACCPLITLTMPFLGSRTIRNRGTIGGTLAHADRSAELPAVAVALDATMMAEGPRGRRAIAAKDFFISDLTTSLEGDELLCEIRFPVMGPQHRFAFAEATNRHHDLALAGLAVVVVVTEDRCEHAALAVIGIGPKPTRLRAAERCLEGQTIGEPAFRAASAASLLDIEFETDVHATAEYRRHVLPGLMMRALRDAMARPEANR